MTNFLEGGLLRDRKMRLLAFVVALVLTIDAPLAQAACVFGIGDCAPSESDGTAALIAWLKEQFPHDLFDVNEFRKTNGVEHDFFGQKVYSMQITAKITFPDGAHKECKDVEPGLGNATQVRCSRNESEYSLGLLSKYREPVAVLNTADGRIEFRKTENGWRDPRVITGQQWTRERGINK